ncbi:hypothetical protein [Ralstonia sp. ASV6]|uniref:hypothetical protein n=1 Tax=Ralstonia sp. ASV6 TaxID=2795124 RepID=UPI0018EB6653|nr:hypothetical protein [Ralstonia sp. ASV6]
MSPDAFRCTEEQFLCDADGPAFWLRQDFSDYIVDIDTSFDPDEVEPVPMQGDHYGFAESEDSALLLFRSGPSEHWLSAQVVGYYNPPGAVCIHQDHQGRGLGAELILWTAVNFVGGPPTEGLDKQAFTTAGYAAHKAAWRLGVKRGLILNESAEAALGEQASDMSLGL